jgi:uncharacterized HAD superfamily protein
MQTLGIDVDGVLSKSLESSFSTSQKELLRKMYNKVATENGVFEKIIKFAMGTYFNYKWANWKKVKLYDENIPFYVKTLSQKYKIVIITSTYGNTENIKRWLKLKNIMYSEFWHVSPSDKHKHCDILIDDRIDILKTLSKKQTGILFSTRKEIELPLNKNILVMKNWGEIYNYFYNVF